MPRVRHAAVDGTGELRGQWQPKRPRAAAVRGRTARRLAVVGRRARRSRCPAQLQSPAPKRGGRRRSAGQPREGAGQLALGELAVDEPGVCDRVAREQVVGVPAQRLAGPHVARDARGSSAPRAATYAYQPRSDTRCPARRRRFCPRHPRDDDVQAAHPLRVGSAVARHESGHMGAASARSRRTGDDQRPFTPRAAGALARRPRLVAAPASRRGRRSRPCGGRRPPAAACRAATDSAGSSGYLGRRR